MKQKKRRFKFFVTLWVVLCIISSVVLGGYFVLDKAVVPKYFSEYGIHNMSELVGMMRTLYSLPSEKQIIKNGYAASDLKVATVSLMDAEYPILEDGTFDFASFNAGKKGNGNIYLTDRELCAVLDKMLDSTEFSDILPNLNHIDTLNMTLLELTITPEALDDNTYSTTDAHIKFVLKIDTTEVRSQMATEIDIPEFLLNMIFPKVMYITCNYDMNISYSDGKSVWSTSNGGLSVNGSTEKQSEILLNLLVSFIFSEQDDMTVDKLLDNFGQIFGQGVELLGDIQFASGITGSMNSLQNGIYFLPVNSSEKEIEE